MRKWVHILGPVLCCALLLAMVTPVARADVWNKKTFVTFSGPVEVSGSVVLPAGKYVLRLVDSPSDRHIVQIMNENEDHLYATILAIPNYRLQPTGKTVITFYEMPSGQPEAIRAWFYPGDNFGQEFAYPKRRAAEISNVVSAEVPVAPENMETAAMLAKIEEPAAVTPPPPRAQPPVTAEASVKSEVETARVESTPHEPAPTPATKIPAERQMPRTAGEMPLVALLGILSIVSAIGVRIAARHLV